MFEVGCTKFALDPEKIAKGKISFLTVTITGVEERGDEDKYQVYTWESWKEKWEFETEFAHENLKDTKEEFVEHCKQMCENWIKRSNEALNSLLKVEKNIKEQKKHFKKEIALNEGFLLELQKI